MTVRLRRLMATNAFPSCLYRRTTESTAALWRVRATSRMTTDMGNLQSGCTPSFSNFRSRCHCAQLARRCLLYVVRPCENRIPGIQEGMATIFRPKETDHRKKDAGRTISLDIAFPRKIPSRKIFTFSDVANERSTSCGARHSFNFDELWANGRTAAGTFMVQCTVCHGIPKATYTRLRLNAGQRLQKFVYKRGLGPGHVRRAGPWLCRKSKALGGGDLFENLCRPFVAVGFRPTRVITKRHTCAP